MAVKRRGIFSGIKHTNQITLGDVIGSSIANIALIIGITALIAPLSVEISLLRKEIPLSFGVQVLFLFLALIGGVISRIDGIILMLVFLLFLFYLWYSSKKSSIEATSENESKAEVNESISNGSITKESIIDETITDEISTEDNFGNLLLKYRLKQFFILCLGLASLIIGGNIVVDSSVNIAHTFGLSEALIGITIVALGTSLPELVTSVVAAIRKESEIAIGNIIGSNIFNILFVLGLSTAINPIKMPSGSYLDVFIMLFSTILFFVLVLFQKKVSRFGGLTLCVFYILFILYKVITM